MVLTPSRMRKRAVLGSLSLLLVAVPSAFGASSKRLVSYYPSWAKTQTPSYSSAIIPFQKMTHIMHAFLLVGSHADGRLNIPQGYLEPALLSKAHAAGVKVSVSVGGASGGQGQLFSKLAANSAARTNFAANLKTFVSTYGYDGVDIDWEVPNAPTDTNNCILLMQSLRSQFPSGQLLLSMAIPSDPRSYGTGFDVPSLAPLLDFINVMTYDFHGPWSNHSGHNSPLILNPADPGQEGSLKTSIDLFLNTYLVPPAQLNIGTAFYGYVFNATKSLWQSCNCASSTVSQNYGTYIKQRINQQGWTSYLDTVAKAPYLLYGNSSQPGFITYDDKASTSRKVNYVLGNRGMGGVFMWDLSADYDGSTQDLLDAMYKAFSKY